MIKFKLATRPVEKIRAKILVLISAIYFANGLSILLEPNAITYAKADPTIKAHLALIGVYQIGWLFILLSVIGWLTVLLKRTWWGYGIIMFQSVFWALLYFISWAETGVWKAVFGASQYVFLAGMLFLCSGVLDKLPPLPEIDPTIAPLVIALTEDVLRQASRLEQEGHHES